MPPPWPGAALAAAAEASIARRAEGQIRPVTGSPLLWKEIRAHRRRGGVLQIVGLLAACGILVWSYVALGSFDSLRSPPIHSTYVILFVLCPVVYLAVHAATRISSEKESRSLPILLTTPLSEWDIVWAKARAVARQTLPAWGFLGLHAAIFTVGGVLHPVILLHLALLAVWVTCFLIGSGLYFSSRCKKTTTAVVMNLGLAIALWAVLPVLAGLTGAGMDLGGLLRWINPLAIASRIAQEAAEKWSTGIDYRYTGQELGLVETTFYLLVVSVAYAGMGALFLLGAARRLRKDIF